jgi:hypothetical protein
MVSGIFLPMVSGRNQVRAADSRPRVTKMSVGMAGWMSARAATVVDSVPPTLLTREDEPTPAARTVVGISSPDGKLID